MGFCFWLSLGALAHRDSPGWKAALRSDVADNSEFEISLKPPVESVRTTQESLDAIMKAENTKLLDADEDFARQKQRMLKAETEAVRNLVVAAFAPLAAALEVADDKQKLR